MEDEGDLNVDEWIEYARGMLATMERVISETEDGYYEAKEEDPYEDPKWRGAPVTKWCRECQKEKPIVDFRWRPPMSTDEYNVRPRIAIKDLELSSLARAAGHEGDVYCLFYIGQEDHIEDCVAGDREKARRRLADDFGGRPTAKEICRAWNSSENMQEVLAKLHYRISYSALGNMAHKIRKSGVELKSFRGDS